MFSQTEKIRQYKLSLDTVQEYTDITEVRKELFEKVYPVYMDELLAKIQSSIDLFSINVSGNVITLKIKKTSIKKYESYSHDSMFYYSIIDRIMYDYISSHVDCPLLCQINVNLFYTITTLGDNIVCIHL